ncbi:TPA: restriction endonuclease subunit S [Acinetobacter baumannii]|nr:restriction endonuclease subunit S [Acinetobacter baumannii]MCZ3091506.1 restriction endonuclease subunit S [Acinetobacter baumannii]MDC4681329.1 restriction endonuclease subunit S [Acinetobacter baumannii]MDQ2389733.1 restriction endonuclease subunit S [Acinetobacter baumannii]HAV4986032.1 restriction endonuclease subunit S [Acinetobacter baumannii]HAV5005065.1 restriction endonuclease subunit S [Acinetobacter baumannii]
MSVPKLRFKEFDGDWSESKLKDCIDSIDSGWSPQCESYPADENEWAVLKTTSVDWDGFKANFNKKLPSNLEARFEIEVKPNDILVTRAGPTERVGVVAVVPHNVRSKLMISDKLIRLKANNENNPEFLGISLSSVKCQNQLQSKTSGLAKSQTNISQKILCDVSLMTPAKAEQTKIASFLSNVDEKISQLTQKHQLLSQYKQGMMQKLFSQEIRFKADDGSEFGEWEETTLGEIGTFKSGQGFPEQFQGGKDGIPFFKVSDMNILGNEKIMKVANNYVNSEAITKMKAKVIDNEAIIFAKVGAAIFLERKRLAKNFLIDNNMMAYLSNQKTNIMFLKQFLDNIKLSKFVQVGALPSYNSSDLAIIPISLPCLEEQTKIANFLSAIDQKLEVVAQQIEQAKTWKKGLLQQMFV